MMFRIFGLLLCLLSAQAWATTYYVDCSAGSNGTGASEADPKNTFSGITPAANDIFYLKPEIECGSSKAMDADAIITIDQNDDNVVIDSYPGSDPCNYRTGENCWILNGGDNVNIGVYGHNNDTFTVRNGYIKNFKYHDFRHWGTDTQNFTVALENVKMYGAGPTDDADATYSTLTKGTCSIVARASNGPYKTDVISHNVMVEHCSRLGFDHRWWIVARHFRFVGADTGYDRIIGGHGMSGHPLTQDYTSGFTYRSGTCPGSDCVYSHAVVASADVEQAFFDRTASPLLKVQRTTDDNTTPSLGYFSVVSNTNIYFNLGYAPPTTGNGVRIIRQPIQVDCYNCEFYGNHVKSDGSLEGAGFQGDDSTPARCFGCYSHDNYGSGFFFYQAVQYYSGLKAGCYGCVALNNGIASECTGTSCGFGIYANSEADIINSVAWGSLKENVGVVGLFNTCGTLANIVAGNGAAYGFRFQNDATTKCTLTDGIAYNNGTDFSSVTGTVISDPGFKGGTSPTNVDDFCLKSTSQLLEAGTYIGAYVTGYNGENLGNPPAIGARGTCKKRQKAATRPKS